MLHFEDDEIGYRSWVRTHPGGVVLDRKASRKYMMHRSTCGHIRWFGARDTPSGSWNYTMGTQKWCFDGYRSAAAWLRDENASVTTCKDCDSAELHRTPVRAEAEPAPLQGRSPSDVAAPGRIVVVEQRDEQAERDTYLLSATPRPQSRRGEPTRGDAPGFGSAPDTVVEPLYTATPLGQALLGHRAGDLIEYRAPGGSQRVRVVEVREADAPPTQEQPTSATTVSSDPPPADLPVMPTPDGATVEGLGSITDGSVAGDADLVIAVADTPALAHQGPGRRVNAAQNKAVERRAVTVAYEHFRDHGYDVEDVGDRESYDLRCQRVGNDRGMEELHVEVKGSTGAGEQVILTANEVGHARRHWPATALAVISEIHLDTSGEESIATGGQLRVQTRWTPSDADLAATQYAYQVPTSRR